MEPAELNDTWWRIPPVLLLLSFGNGWAEEVVVVGFLLTRLRQLRVNPPWTALIASSLLRGAYHLYQGGFGAGWAISPWGGWCSGTPGSAQAGCGR